MSAPDSELSAGDVFAGHRIVAVAGRGGMGVVYRAIQLDLDRPVALKLIAAPLARDEEFRERFVRESRAAAAIDHPNVIPVYSAGEDDGRLYLAMRLVEGDDLRTMVRATGPLSPASAAAIIAQVASALDAAHARGLIHRDIKPANVLLDGDHAYLTDFGLTKRLQGEETMTGSGRWVGTLGYIAPEQIRGEPVDARSDVFALGCLLFYLLTGAAPYRRDSDEATLYAYLHDPAPDARDLAPRVPAALAAVVTRALEKEPARRFPSAGDLGRAAIAAVDPDPARRPSPDRAVAPGAPAGGPTDADRTAVSPADARTTVDPRRDRRGRSRPAMIAGAALAAGAAAVVAVLARGDAGDRAPAPPARTTATDPSTGSRTTVAVGRKPNNLAYVRGRVWVTLQQTNRLVEVDPDGRRRPRPHPLPWKGGSVGVAYGSGALWVLSTSTYQVAKLDPRSGRLEKAIALPRDVTRGVTVAIATGMGRVWIARRGRANPDSLLALDPHTSAISSSSFAEEGINSIAVGDGRVWVTNRRHDRLTAFDPDHPDRRRDIPVGAVPRGLAFGHGAAWVADYGDGTLARVDARTLDFISSPTGGSGPLRVASSSAGIWVVNGPDNSVSIADVRTGDLLRGPVRVGHNPFAVAAHGRRAWVANRGDGTVTRVDLPAAVRGREGR